MKREKSCGAVVFRKKGANPPDVLLIRHRYGGHWSFPKGHVEDGENEVQTALREVKEETGLSIKLSEGFRECVEYYPKPNVKKLVVYFLGYAEDDHVCKQDEEVSETKWLGLDDALNAVTFRNDKNLITAAKNFLEQK